MSRNVRYALIILVAILAWLFSGFFIDSDNPGADSDSQASNIEMTHVEVMSSAAKDYQPSMAFNARTEPFRFVSLSAETSGVIISTDVMEGSSVNEGAVVGRIRIEDRELRVVEAEALLEQTRLDYEGAKELKARGLISDAELARNRFSVESATAGLENAKLELDRAAISAPFDGVLNDRFVEQGDFIQRGQVYAEFMQLDPIKAVFQVSEREILELDTNEPVYLRLSDGRELKGSVLFRSSKADQKSRAFVVEAVFDNPDNQILADLTGVVSVFRKSVSAHSLPAALLTLDATGGLSIKAVNADNEVESYPVELVTDAQDSVWVTGLPPSARIIVTGHEYAGVGEVVKTSARDVEGMAANLEAAE